MTMAGVLAESRSALKKGDHVSGRYTVLREIGRGGMAAVYLCHDGVADENVALKVLFFEQPNAAQKYAIWFHQEARALASLDHPAIVHARDFGAVPDGAPYLVMDMIDGRSLHGWKHVAEPPWPVVWTLMDQVLGGLAHAHARGVIHGDLKPSNIMLDARGGSESPRAYILDLGLAWILADHSDPRLSGRATEAPAMPLGGGTPGWLAPEQIRHATPHVGPPTDLYALGCILHELVTGREVFDGSAEEVLRLHRDAPVPPPKLLRDVPAPVGPFVVKLLAKRPWHRFRYAAEARAAWSAMKPSEPIRWVPPSVSQLRASTPAKSSPSPVSGPAQKRLAPGIVALRPSPLVGRETERLQLEKHVRELTREEGPRHRLVVLEGEAGLGKSRLAEWLCEHVHEHALMVPLRARYRRTPSPIDGVRGAILGHYNLIGHGRDVIEQALMNEWEVGKTDDDGRTWVAASAAWLRPPAPDEPAELGPAGKRFVLDKPELGRAISRHALAKIAQGRPLVLWLDDVHLAPPATAEGLLYLRQDISALRFFLVATVRREALDADTAATQRLETLCRIFPSERLRMGALTEDEMQKLLQATLPLSPETERVAVERSHGNPLFALQLVHAWAGGGHFRLRDGLYSVDRSALRGRAVTTGELWEERLDGVEGDIRPAAFAAAALGHDIPYDVFVQLLASLNVDVERATFALQKAQILFPEAGDRFRWSHALLQEHVFGRLCESDDAHRVFRLAADALLFHPDAGTERIVRQRVQTLLYAGEITHAADVLFNFIAVAWSRVRDAAATRVGLSLLDGRVEGRQAALQLRWRAEVERHEGNLPLARADAELAAKIHAELDDDDDQAHCLRLLAQIACDEGKPSAGRPFVEDAYAKFVESGNDAGRAECEFVIGQIDALIGQYDDASIRLAHAAQGFRACGESLSLAQCILVQARAEMAGGKLSATRDLLTEARAEFLELGYPLGLAQVDLALAQVSHNAEQHAEAFERATATKSRFEALGSVRGMTDSSRLAAMAALDVGDLAAAREQAKDAYALATQARFDPWGQVEAASLLAQVALAEGDLETATDYFGVAQAVAIDDAEPLQHRELTGAWLHLSAGRVGDAVLAITAARKAFADPRRAGDHTPQLVARLARLSRGTAAAEPLDSWHQTLRSRMSNRPPALP